jgi:hypothetical protein
MCIANLLRQWEKTYGFSFEPETKVGLARELAAAVGRTLAESELDGLARNARPNQGNHCPSRRIWP